MPTDPLLQRSPLYSDPLSENPRSPPDAKVNAVESIAFD